MIFYIYYHRNHEAKTKETDKRYYDYIDHLLFACHLNILIIFNRKTPVSYFGRNVKVFFDDNKWYRGVIIGKDPTTYTLQ